MRIQSDDILLNKAAIIERCIKRIRSEYKSCPDLDNYTHVDAMILNVERACQATIDMAMHLVAVQHLGIPQSSADAFALLKKNDILSDKLYGSLKAMTGFRNVAIHEYQELDTSILHYIAEKGYKDLLYFCKCLNIKIIG